MTEKTSPGGREGLSGGLYDHERVEEAISAMSGALAGCKPNLLEARAALSAMLSAADGILAANMSSMAAGESEEAEQDAAEGAME